MKRLIVESPRVTNSLARSFDEQGIQTIRATSHPGPGTLRS